MNTRTLAIAAALLALSCMAEAQTPSGLLTGPVTYTSTLTSGNPYGDTHVWTKADGSTCSAAGTPSCYIIKYLVGVPYGNLQASDGTSTGIPNCYTWDVWQLILNDVGYCQSSFHGGGSGEQRAGLYCGNTVSSDINGTYNLSCTATFGGTANNVINGIDVPIPTQYTIQVTITHHPVQVWIGPVYRTPRHLETWQAIDSAVVRVTPVPAS